MNCASCGYHYSNGLEDAMSDKIPFLELEIYNHGNQYNGVLKKGKMCYQIYACPKCGTVKIDL